MGLPKAVQEQIERADRAVKGLTEATTPVQEHQAAEEPFADTGAPPVLEVDGGKSEPEPEPEIHKPDIWETKYRVLQGKYDAEVPRLAAENRELSAKLEGLYVAIANMQTNSARPNEESGKPLVSHEEVEEYGTEMLDVTSRYARQAMTKDFEAMANRVAQLESMLSELGGRQAKTERKSFTEVLASKVPDYAVLDEDPAFIAWLEDMGKAAFDDAVRTGNADRVAKYFLTYKTITGVPDHQVPEVRKPELEKFVSPGKPKSAPAPQAQAAAKAYTQAEIKKFYQDVVSGAYRGREAEKDRIEREIIESAQRAA